MSETAKETGAQARKMVMEWHRKLNRFYDLSNDDYVLIGAIAVALAERDREIERLKAMAEWAHTCVNHTDAERAAITQKCPVCLKAEVERLKGELSQHTERRFTVLDGPSIPWSVIAPHERQAQANHDQSLERLAQRGGLACSEAVAVLEDRRYHAMPYGEARARLIELVDGDCKRLKSSLEHWRLDASHSHIECDNLKSERDTLKELLREAVRLIQSLDQNWTPRGMEFLARPEIAALSGKEEK